MKKQSMNSTREWLAHEIVKSLKFTRLVDGRDIGEWTSIDSIESRVRRFARYREVVKECFSARVEIHRMVGCGRLEIDDSGDMVRFSGAHSK